MYIWTALIGLSELKKNKDMNLREGYVEGMSWGELEV